MCTLLIFYKTCGIVLINCSKNTLFHFSIVFFQPLPFANIFLFLAQKSLPPPASAPAGAKPYPPAVTAGMQKGRLPHLCVVSAFAMLLMIQSYLPPCSWQSSPWISHPLRHFPAILHSHTTPSTFPTLLPWRHPPADTLLSTPSYETYFHATQKPRATALKRWPGASLFLFRRPQ